MDSKLTLKLDTSVIERAKLYAREQNISLSKLIENYLDALTMGERKEVERVEISPLVKSLTGVVKLEEGEDVKKLFRLLV